MGWVCLGIAIGVPALALVLVLLHSCYRNYRLACNGRPFAWLRVRFGWGLRVEELARRLDMPAGEQIPLCGRIVAVADVYDALTSKRVYKAAYCHDVARSIVLEGAGSHFDPAVVQAYRDCERQIVAIAARYGVDVGPASDREPPVATAGIASRR